MRKIFLACLTIFMLLLLISCGDTATQNTKINTTTEIQTVIEETEKVEINWESAGLPAIDYEGATFTTLYGAGEPDLKQTWRLIHVDEENGDVLNDAIYKRNSKIAEIYNINFDVIYSTGFQSSLQNSVNAGDNAYDTVFGSATTLLAMAQESYLLNFYDFEYTNLEAVWWDQSVIEGLTVYDKLHMCTGAISPLTDVRVYSLVFNKDMCRNLGLDLPYQSVLDGNWTIDLFSRYIADVNYDVNGDGVMDYEDRWGYFSQDGNSYMMYFSGGGRVTDITSDGGRVLSFNTERNINLAIEALTVSIDKTKTLMANKYVSDNGGSWPAASAWFASGGSLMRSSVFEPVPRDYRAMDTDFGVLPYPKLDEHQDRYYTLPEETSMMYAVPITSDSTYVSLILEALSAESVLTVSDAFYEVSLSGKVIRDNESKEMLDIIFGSKMFDVGYFASIGSVSNSLKSLETSSSTDAASKFESQVSAAQTALEKFLTKYQALD